MKKFLLAISCFSFFGLEAQTLLFDQTDSITTGGILCREHTTASSAQFNTEGADDFTVPNGQFWRIDSVIVEGFYNAVPDTNTPTIVTIYSDDNGEPDAVVAEREIVDGDIGDDGRLEPDFSDDPIFLQQGTYWLSVKIEESDYPWYWQRINAQETSNPFHWYNPGGGYNVCTSWQPLFTCISTITDSSANFQIYGCVNPPLLTAFIDDTVLCQGDSVTISLTTTSTNVSYEWSSGETTSSVTVDSTMYYEVTITDNNSGCAFRAHSNVLVNENPIIEELDGDTICAGDTTSISGSSAVCPSGMCQYVWNGDTGIVFHLTSVQGWHTLQVFDAVTGCSSEIDSAWLELEVPLPPQMDPDSGFYLCDGDTGVITVTNAYAEYYWSTGLDSNAITVVNAGEYRVTVTTELGCEAFDTVEVEVKALPTTAITTSVTNSFKTKLKAEEGFVSYLWSTGDDDRETTVDEDGQYTVTVTDSFGCEGVTTIFVNVIPSGIVDAENSQLKVYPNPADEILNIQWQSDFEPAQLQLMDATGRIVVSKRATQSLEQLDLHGIPSGYYMLNIIGADSKTTMQVLKH